MPNITKANKILDQIIVNLNSLKQTLNDEPVAVAPPIVMNPQLEDDFSNFEQLKKALETNKWPEAVNANLICDLNSEEDKCDRGRGILEMMIEDDLKDARFLDYGCGEGHCAKFATDFRTSISVGFDIQRYNQWDNMGSVAVLTNDIDKVRELGPYNIILLYDVLDHAIGEPPASILKKATEVLIPNGKIYIRCHPFTSRHATHLYHELNKAYVHLVFTEEEIKQLLPDAKHILPNIGITRPLMTYEGWIKEAGLTIINRRDVTERVEPFFKIPKIAERIIKKTEFDAFPEFQMGLMFIDYVLEKR